MKLVNLMSNQEIIKFKMDKDNNYSLNKSSKVNHYKNNKNIFCKTCLKTNK